MAYRQLDLALSERQVLEIAVASSRWRKTRSADFWERWEFDSQPPVGLYLGHGTGPCAGARVRKVDTWPTPFDADDSAVIAALKEAASSLGGAIAK